MMYVVNPKPGDIVSIYILGDDGEYVLEGSARLIEKLPNWRTPEPIPIQEVSPNVSVNVLREKWKVEVVSNNPFDHGRRLIRWVNSYHSTGLIKIPDIEDIDEDDLPAKEDTEII